MELSHRMVATNQVIGRAAYSCNSTACIEVRLDSFSHRLDLEDDFGIGLAFSTLEVLPQDSPLEQEIILKAAYI